MCVFFHWFFLCVAGGSPGQNSFGSVDSSSSFDENHLSHVDGMSNVMVESLFSELNELRQQVHTYIQRIGCFLAHIFSQFVLIVRGVTSRLSRKASSVSSTNFVNKCISAWSLSVRLLQAGYKMTFLFYRERLFFSFTSCHNLTSLFSEITSCLSRKASSVSSTNFVNRYIIAGSLISVQ